MGEELLASERSLAGKPNKIFHFGNFDVIVPTANLTDDIYQEIGELTKFINDNEIDDIAYCGSQGYERRHFVHPQGESEGKQTYFIKKRSKVDKEVFTNVRQNAKEYGAPCIETKNRLTAAASTLNEINNIPHITQILESKDVKELTLKYGLADISIIAPIFAIINRPNNFDKDKDRFADKYLVYPNKSGLIQPYQTEELRPKINDIKNELVEIFKKNGISVQDYGVGQFLFDEENKTLYLIDTETWFKTN